MFRKIKIMIIVLLVVMISLIAFWGIFTKENGVWNNLIPNYKLSLDVEGSRELRHMPDTTEEDKYVYVDENGNIKGEVWEDGSATTEDHEAEHENEEGETEEEELPYTKETRTIKVNHDDSLNKENFEQTKKIIQKRLKSQGILEYNIRLDDVTGSLLIETNNNNDNVAKIEELVSGLGKFEIIDYQNGLVLMDNSDIKNTTVVTSNNSGYETYLQVEFNKEGSEKLREISTKYVEEKNKTESEEAEESAETEKKYISIVVDDTTIMSTYFAEEMTNGVLQIPVGENTSDYDEYMEHYNSAKVISDMLNSGMLPVKYSLEVDNFVNSDLIKDAKIYGIIAIVVVICISIIFIVKFKLQGLLASLLGIGYIGILTLVIRYTNATITESAVVAYCITILLNYIFMKNYLKNSNKDYMEIFKEFFLKLIPMFIIGIVFTLVNYYIVSSIGMAIFWGLILSVLYNLIFTNIIFNDKERIV